MKGELNLSNYVTKADLKIATGVDASKFAEKDVDKLVPVPVDLSKLSDVVKNDFVTKDVCNGKTENIEDKILDITNLATNTTPNAKINEVKGEIPDMTNLSTNTTLNAKINVVEDKIPSITSLGTTTACTAVENKIPNVSNLVKKTIMQKLMKLKRKLLIMIMI